MIAFDKSRYYTVEEFRQRCGFSNAQRIYRAIWDDRIVGVVKANGVYFIPLGAVIIDKRVKSGKYVGISRIIRERGENK